MGALYWDYLLFFSLHKTYGSDGLLDNTFLKRKKVNVGVLTQNMRI